MQTGGSHSVDLHRNAQAPASADDSPSIGSHELLHPMPLASRVLQHGSGLPSPARARAATAAAVTHSMVTAYDVAEGSQHVAVSPALGPMMTSSCSPALTGGSCPAAAGICPAAGGMPAIMLEDLRAMMGDSFPLASVTSEDRRAADGTASDPSQTATAAAAAAADGGYLVPWSLKRMSPQAELLLRQRCRDGERQAVKRTRIIGEALSQGGGGRRLGAEEAGWAVSLLLPALPGASPAAALAGVDDAPATFPSSLTGGDASTTHAGSCVGMGGDDASVGLARMAAGGCCMFGVQRPGAICMPCRP